MFSGSENQQFFYKDQNFDYYNWPEQNWALTGSEPRLGNKNESNFQNGSESRSSSENGHGSPPEFGHTPSPVNGHVPKMVKNGHDFGPNSSPENGFGPVNGHVPKVVRNLNGREYGPNGSPEEGFGPNGSPENGFGLVNKYMPKRNRHQNGHEFEPKSRPENTVGFMNGLNSGLVNGHELMSGPNCPGQTFGLKSPESLYGSTQQSIIPIHNNESECGQQWTDIKIKHERVDYPDFNPDFQPHSSAYLPGDQFDPSTKSFSHDELRPAPIIKKRKKVNKYEFLRALFLNFRITANGS